MEWISDRITINDEICNGKPTIRGLRITVQTILEYLIFHLREKLLEMRLPYNPSKEHELSGGCQFTFEGSKVGI